MEHDPITVADHLRWAREHWKCDHNQPIGLDNLMLRAAETLERTVHRNWRIVAALEALVLLFLAITYL